MVSVIKKNAIVGKNGKIEIYSDLTPGTNLEIVVLVE
jgi:hypothetical protein